MPKAQKEEEKKNEVVEEAVVEKSEAGVPTTMVSSDVTYEKIDGIEVGNPQALRPVELPLVVKAPKGGWSNDAQESFAQTLNAYAYKNPEKWETKKEVLIKQLVELAKNPKKLNFLTGTQGKGKLEYSNKAIETDE